MPFNLGLAVVTEDHFGMLAVSHCKWPFPGGGEALVVRDVKRTNFKNRFPKKIFDFHEYRWI